MNASAHINTSVQGASLPAAESLMAFEHAYIAHLVALGDENPVYANMALKSSSGELICDSGLRMDDVALMALDASEMQLPVFAVVSLGNELTAEQLYLDIMSTINDDDSLKIIAKAHLDANVVKACCKLLCRYAVLRQHLSVMRVRLPATYRQSIFCAWLSTVIYQKMNKAGPEIGSLFIAGMCHDIGMLHINPEIQAAKRKLTAQEWLEVKTHAQIGSNILSLVKGLPRDVSAAVADHHELPDGTGYPKGKIARDISSWGQLIQLLDSVYAVYRKHHNKSQRTLGDLIPVIKVNLDSRYAEAGRVLITLLEPTTSKEPAVPAEVMPAFIDTVKCSLGYTLACTDILREYLTSFGYTHGNRAIHLLQNSMIHIVATIERSEIINEGYVRFLELVHSEKLTEHYREIERAYLMDKEVLFHIEKLRRYIWQFVMAQKESALGQKLTQCLMILDEIPDPPVSAELEGLWIVKY